MRHLALCSLIMLALAAQAETPAEAPAPSTLPPPVTDADFRLIEESRARLGQLLFHDKVISGNRTISCATCHHPRFGTSDGQSLALGEGGIGLGPDRVADPANMPEQRIPRNSPALWNLGAHEFIRMFHDGRLEKDSTRPSGLRTPLEDEMVAGFSSILSAQNMFPVLSPDEMAGHYDENEVSTAVRQGIITAPGGAWDKIAARVEAIPEYRALFDAAEPETRGRKLAFSDISNAIADFVAFEFRSDDSPFDAFLRGEGDLAPEARAGMALFYGKAGCADCHSGPFQTDHGFHAMGTPQLGPGKGERFERHQRDIGRMRVTNRPEDRYAFRTPSLRNVTLTAPYGHAGGHSDLGAFLRFHADPVAGLASYRRSAVLAPFKAEKPDWAVMEDAAEVAAIAGAVTRPPVALSESEFDQILAFLKALESPTAATGRLGIPARVPSGLPVDR
jgi:cytochrome c peroxidase